MRVLILFTAIVAGAAAAPSGLLTPVARLTIPAVAIPAVLPTISPGDLHAAAIDAQVQAEDQARLLQDQARLAADQAKELTEQVVETQTEKVIEINDAVQEKSQEIFWAGEDKKWQAVDALKTAEAQIDGSVASNAAAIAKSAIGGVIVPSPFIPIGPAITPYSQLVFTPGIVAPIPELKSEVKTEEPATKAAEAPQEVEKPADAVQVESEAIKTEPKPAENLKAVAPLSYVPVVSPVGPVLKYADPWLTPVAYIQPGHQTFTAAAIPQIHGQFLTPAYISA